MLMAVFWPLWEKLQTKIIRQYFPKGSSFENITNQQIQFAQQKLNNRPGKKLGFLSPVEFLLLNLANQKVAFVS